MNPLAQLLGLELHDEGGYFRQLYESAQTVATKAGERPLMNTILYLLCEESPTGHLHRNRSDITHFHHLGGPARYVLVSPAGELGEVLCGSDPAAGHVVCFTVPGGWWKTSHLPEGVTECLISEAVAPGFRYEDRELATLTLVSRLFPDLVERLRPFILE